MLVVWSQMTKINRTPVRPVARRIASRYLSRTVLLFAIAHGFGQQSPDAKTAVTLSVICASNFVRTARTAIVLVPRHRQRPSCGAIFIEGGPRLSKVITIFSLTASAIICQKCCSTSATNCAVTSTARSFRKYGVENKSVVFIKELPI